MTQVEDEEPALLLAKLDKEEGDVMLLNEKQVMPALLTEYDRKKLNPTCGISITEQAIT